VYLLQYAFNIFSHNAPVLENGYNEEEMKMVKETRKIWVSETIDYHSAH
jgi:aspartate-semialdehyde dehydrogenase